MTTRRHSLRGGEHVCLVHRDNTSLAAAGEPEGPAGHPLDLLAGVGTGVRRRVLGAAPWRRSRGRRSAPGRRSGRCRAWRTGRRLANASSSLRSASSPASGRTRRGVPARAADRAQQHRVGRLDGRPHVARERLAVRSMASPPNGRCTCRTRMPNSAEARVDHAAGLGHHFGADAVAGKAGDDGDGRVLVMSSPACSVVRVISSDSCQLLFRFGRRLARASTPAGRPQRMPR